MPRRLLLPTGLFLLPTDLRRRKTDQCVGQAQPVIQNHSCSEAKLSPQIADTTPCQHSPLFAHLHEAAWLHGNIRRYLPTMLTRLQQIESIRDLREYVNTILCSHCQLKAGAFSMTERVLMRAGKPCGVYFCLHGPRATKFTAIWEMDRNQVLFYSSRGERFLKTQLLVAPRFESAAA